ncbi:MAG: hypothetical protein EP343_00245 [Deltaproteobacteria bacterium]|nr:MAG: hypothetical protein EP343_00245 [Deltaproteobacteria bacterium]
MRDSLHIWFGLCLGFLGSMGLNPNPGHCETGKPSTSPQTAERGDSPPQPKGKEKSSRSQTSFGKGRPWNKRPRKCRTRVRMFHSRKECDVAILPVNVSAGTGVALDSKDTWGLFSASAEVFILHWRYLSWTAAELRIAIYTACSDTNPEPPLGCFVSLDFFVGSRPGVTLHLDAKRKHQISFGLGVGWGSIGSGWGLRDGNGSGLVISPSVRYLFLNFLGLEVVALLPLYAAGAERFPALITFNLVGAPLALLALTRAR